MTTRSVAPVFARLAKVSPRWAALLSPPRVISPELGLGALELTLRKALEAKMTAEQLTDLEHQLTGYHLSPLLASRSELDLAGRLFKLRFGFSDETDPRLRQILTDFFTRVEPDYKTALYAALDVELAKDLAPLDERRQDAELFELRDLFEHKPFNAGLTTADLLPLAPRLTQWLAETERVLHKSSTLNEVRPRILPAVLALIARAPHLPPNALDTYLTAARHLSKDEGDELLARFDDTVLRSVLFRPTPNEFFDGHLTPALVKLTGLTDSEVRAVGVSKSLIERLRRDSSEELLSKAAEEHPEAKSDVQAAQTKLSDFNRTLSRLLTRPLIQSRILARLNSAGLAHLTAGLSLRKELDLQFDVLLHPHLIWMGDWTGISISTLHEFAKVLLERLVDLQATNLDFATWNQIYGDLARAQNLTPQMLPLNLRTALGDYAVARLNAMKADERYAYLRQPHVLSLLPVEAGAEFLSAAYLARAEGLTLPEKQGLYVTIRTELKLRAEYPDIDRLLQEKVAERERLQPGELEGFFADENGFFQTDAASALVRAMSGMVAEVQTLSMAEQIEFIDYLTGRTESVPTSVARMSHHIRTQVDSSINFDDLVFVARGRLARATNVERGLILLPFYTGPSSLIGFPDGERALQDKLLEAISPRNRPLAASLAKDLFKAEGRMRSLAYAMVFGLKGQSGQPLTEGEIFRALFTYGFGAPGVKAAQYLAFTSEMSSLKELLSELQDQAMPLSYLQAIQLLEKNFPDGLPDGIRILGIKGSGSVNIGIEYYNPLTSTEEVMSVPREGIEAATNEDFRRLHNAFVEVSSHPEGQARFGFLVGLTPVLKRSVELEFDRPRVYRNHRALAKILDRRVDGWRVKLVDPYALDHGRVIRMQKAAGRPARLVEMEDPTLYREAMGAAAQVLTDHLLREDGRGGDEFFADSDFHNGQAFIDDANKTVWLIDPGQAVPISKVEFQTGQLILRMLSSTIDAGNAVRALNASSINPHPEAPFFSRAEIEALMAAPDANDAFIKFLAACERKGGHVPLPAVQWVFGMNRQLALARNLGKPLERRLFNKFLGDSSLDLVRHLLRAVHDLRMLYRKSRD